MEDLHVAWVCRKAPLVQAQGRNEVAKSGLQTSQAQYGRQMICINMQSSVVQPSGAQGVLPLCLHAPKAPSFHNEAMLTEPLEHDQSHVSDWLSIYDSQSPCINVKIASLSAHVADRAG